MEQKTGHVAQLGTLSTVAVARQRRGAAAYEAGMAVVAKVRTELAVLERRACTVLRQPSETA